MFLQTISVLFYVVLYALLLLVFILILKKIPIFHNQCIMYDLFHVFEILFILFKYLFFGTYNFSLFENL